jgi:hypothetical protein
MGSYVAAFSQLPIGIKIGLFFVSWGVVWLPIALPISKVVEWSPFQPLELRQKLPLVGALYAIAPVLLWGFSRLERVPFSTYGLAWTGYFFKSLAWGIGLGAIGIIILFGTQIIVGWKQWQRANFGKFAAALLPSLLLGLWIGITEELIFRGFLFGQLWQAFDFWSAAIGSSLIFAALHLVWEGADNIPQLPGLSLMGLVLCLAVSVNSESVGLATGLHASWIWLIASLDTSGLISAHSSEQKSAPVWFIGFEEKPLTGLLGLLFLLGTGFCLVIFAGLFQT